jgi:antitoxin component of MazEF toxin-antitoxin module
MRRLAKLVRNGNSVQVTISRPYLNYLGWAPGDDVITEILEDQSLRIRRPLTRDFARNDLVFSHTKPAAEAKP